MSAPKTETVQTTVRLTNEDHANADRIIATGAATNLSEAVRVALAIAAGRIAK